MLQTVHWPDQDLEGSQLDTTPAKSQGSNYNYIKQNLNLAKSRIFSSSLIVYIILPPYRRQLITVAKEF